MVLPVFPPDRPFPLVPAIECKMETKANSDSEAITWFFPITFYVRLTNDAYNFTLAQYANGPDLSFLSTVSLSIVLSRCSIVPSGPISACLRPFFRYPITSYKYQLQRSLPIIDSKGTKNIYYDMGRIANK